MLVCGAEVAEQMPQPFKTKSAYGAYIVEDRGKVSTDAAAFPIDAESMWWASLVQLSVVRVFAQILTDKAFKSQAHSTELIHFCTSTTQNLFSRLLPEATAYQSSEQGKDLRPISVFLSRID